MDATELALLAGVCAEPAEDAPRLVYADWLTENGQEGRAEFIRVQCDIALNGDCKKLKRYTSFMFDEFEGSEETAFDEGPRGYVPETRCGSCDRCRAKVRERALQRSADFPSWRGPVVLNVCNWSEYRRGFIDRLACTAENFFAHADALIWRPDQTRRCTGCGKCKPAGHIYTGKDGMKWIECRQSRPCPPTAEPITRVTLTSWPDQGSLWNLGANHPVGRGNVKGILENAFRGVTFTLPPQVAVSTTVAGTPPAPDLPPEDDGPDLSGYVACGNGHVPAGGYTVEIESDGLADVADGTDMKSSWPIATPARAVFTLTYPLISQTPTPPSISQGVVFGPISGTIRTGQRVTAQRVMLRRVEIQMQGNHAARASVEAVAMGAVTLD